MAGEQVVYEVLGDDDSILGLSGLSGYGAQGWLLLSTGTVGQVTNTDDLSETVDSEPINFQKTSLGRM